MAAVAGSAALGLYELGMLAAAALIALFVASPQGQQATQEAARATADALEKLRPAPQKDPEQKPKPIPVPPTLIQKCPPEEEQEEKCPVCELYPNPTPGQIPAYVRDNRVPKDSETLPPLTSYKRTRKVVKQARVYERPDGTFIHRDTLHRGKGAELEVYNRSEEHIGTICPHCGAPREPKVPNRKLPKD